MTKASRRIPGTARVKDLPIPRRVKNALLLNRFHTLNDVVALTYKQMVRRKRMGPVSTRILILWLQQAGWDLK